jgi:GT2 family glycosyltransferase
MYGEDVDLASRAHRAGYRPIICPSAKLVHEVGQSSAQPIDKMLLLFKGKAQLARTHWKGGAQRFALACLYSGVAVRAALARVVSAVKPRSALARWHQLWIRRAEWSQGYENYVASGASLPH